MRITEKERSIARVADVQSGYIPPGRSACHGRTSDAFVCILSGRAVYEFAEGTQTAKAGDVLFLAQGSSYRIHVVQAEYTFIVVNFFWEDCGGQPVWTGKGAVGLGQLCGAHRLHGGFVSDLC